MRGVHQWPVDSHPKEPATRSWVFSVKLTYRNCWINCWVGGDLRLRDVDVTSPQWICFVGFMFSWWRHQMETFSALLAICAGNSPVPGEFPTQRPVTRSFDVFFDLRLNKPLSKQSWGWWLETLSRPLWRHLNDYILTDNTRGQTGSSPKQVRQRNTKPIPETWIFK